MTECSPMSAVVRITLGCALSVAGCSLTMESKEVVARWTEHISPIRERGEVQIGPPVLGPSAPTADEASLCLNVLLERRMSYQVRQRQQDVEAVRCRMLIPQLIEEHGRFSHLSREERQTRYIEELKAGSSVAFDDVDARVTYWRVVGNVRPIITEHKEDMPPIPAPGLWLRLVVEGNCVATTKTDSQGQARLVLAKTLAEALRLGPFTASVEVESKGKWSSLGTVTVGERSLDTIVRHLQDESMRVRGDPRGVPFARVELKASPDPIRPGETCCLSLTVSNFGQGTFYGLAAESSSAIAAFDGLRFRFGHVEPGMTLTLVQSVRIQSGKDIGPVSVRLEFSEHNGQAPDPLTVKLRTTGGTPLGPYSTRRSHYFG